MAIRSTRAPRQTRRQRKSTLEVVAPPRATRSTTDIREYYSETQGCDIKVEVPRGVATSEQITYAAYYLNLGEVFNICSDCCSKVLQKVCEDRNTKSLDITGGDLTGDLRVKYCECCEVGVAEPPIRIAH